MLIVWIFRTFSHIERKTELSVFLKLGLNGTGIVLYILMKFIETY